MPQEVKKIALALIDDPRDAVRTHMDQEALADLVESIRAHGLIQPIVVKPVNGRYEVVAGHRRTAAHRALGYAEIEAIVRDYTEAQAESTKLHENLFRENVNPVDEATFLARYIKNTSASVEDIAKMLHRTVDWVEGRLEILLYPDYMINEIYAGKIALGVARYLAQIPNEQIKKEYTRFAALQGINIITAKRWLSSAKGNTLPANPANLPEGQDYYETPARAFITKCAICQQNDEIVKMESDLVHPDCRRQMAFEIHNAQTATGVEGAVAP